MSEQVRGIFICPDCGGPSTATGDGHACCSDCQKLFLIPEEASKRAQKSASILGGEKPKTIQRNIILNARDANSEFSKVEKISEPLLPAQDIEELKSASAASRSGREKRRKRLKKRNKLTPVKFLKWFAIWASVVVIILLVVSRFQNQYGANTRNALTIEERLVGEEREFYRIEYPRIQRMFQEFLRSQTVGQMSEYVLDTRQVDRKMNRYFQENVRRTAAMGLKPSPAFWNVAFEESPGFVEVAWDGGTDGFFEGVFLKVEESWKIDWEHFTRYSSENWTVFNQRIGGSSKGLFRVYVEKVSEGEGADFERWVKVRIAPPFSDKERRRLESSELILMEGGDQATSKISGLFLERSGQSEGFSKLWERDPRGLRRAILELEWAADSTSGEERMVITDVLADNWRALDATGEVVDSQE